MNKAAASFRSVLNPKPPVIVSCRGKNGKNNALVVVYAGNCSFDPPMLMVGIVPSRYSYGLVKETGCFVVNLVPPSLKSAWDYIGSHSGRDEEDKLASAKVVLADGIKVPAPVLTECPVNIECSVVDSIRTGSHEMFIGKIEYVHAPEACVDAEGNIDWSKIDLLKV